MPRIFILPVLAICLPLSLSAASSAPTLPTETDTIELGRSVVLTRVQGQMYRVVLEPISSGATVHPGDVLLVPKGTAFAIDRMQIGAEQQGDRFIRIN
jgi:hypothetical protein